ncbi:MAG TPA: AAC(3)-I family aminoglycoside N-acetyltransferase [Rhizomicrobium sp.]|nr:AAC(3)-I family aminoglycoside N-acetyltransferase [Rhizomicrobium sp.]
MSHDVRQLVPGDAGTMRAMLTMFGHAFEDVPTYCDRQPSDAYLKRLLGRNTFIALVAIGDDGNVSGGLAAYVLDKFEQARSEIYIYDLAVAEPYRRQGIATVLIEVLREVTRQRGAYVIFVQADPPDDAAAALDTKLGIRKDVLHFDIEAQPDAER